MNIDPEKRVIEIMTDKMLLSMTHQPRGTKIHPEAMGLQNTVDKSMDIKAQIRVLEKNKRKTHF